ncbi:MAG: RNA 2',3'-cyclic phosphodiesterase [Candidatus Aenigmatarchaeota archaeon]
MVRCFVGVLIPESLKEKILDLQNYLSSFIKAKFVEKENLHLCFSFLGEKNEEEIDLIKKSLDEISKNFKTFEIKIKGIKLIPSEKFVRVIALDTFDEKRISESLRFEILNKIDGDSKPLHLTLCRVKSMDRKKFFENIKKIRDLDIGIFSLNSIQLIKSELSKKGPVYEIIYESRLS